MAEARRRDLDIPRHVARELGQSAVAASKAGEYKNPGAPGAVPITGPNRMRGNDQPAARCHVSYRSRVGISFHQSPGLERNHPDHRPPLGERGRRPLALNFANGLTPGGELWRVL